MIIDKIENLSCYSSLIPKIIDVQNYLKITNLNEVGIGKFDLPNTEIFYYCFDYITKPIEQCSGEAHIRYIDLHIIVGGSETVGVIESGDDGCHPYDSVNDYRKVEGKFRHVDLHSGDFVIFFPHEGHITGGQAIGYPPDRVKRVVFKLSV